MNGESLNKIQGINFIAENLANYYYSVKDFLLDGEFTNGSKVNKFAWNFKRNIFLLCGAVHAGALQEYREYGEYDNWVRGIYLREVNAIYLRDTVYFNEDENKNFNILYNCKEVLERLGREKETRIILGCRDSDFSREIREKLEKEI